MVTEQVIVKLGYQQTEVGIIPEDWNVKTFKDVCWVNQGLQININLRHKNPSPKSKAYITIQYLNDGKEIEYIDDYKISVCCKKEDVLMTRTGNTGIIVSGVEGVFHNNFFKINYDKTILNREYLIYFLNQKIIQRIILTKAGTSTIPDLNHSDFYSVPIIFPKPKEQSNITKVLSDTDGLITQLDYLITKKKNIKQGVMQELLTGKKRLHGFEKKQGTKQSELGLIPENWDVVELGNYAFITKLAGFEYTLHFNSYKDGGDVIVIRGTNITHNKLDLSDVRTIPQTTSNKLPRSQLSKDDLVFAYVGTIGPVYLVESNNLYHLGPNTCKIHVEGKIVPKFLLVYFTSWLLSNEIVKQTSVGAQPSLSMSKIRKFLIILPPTKEEQSAIVQILSDMDAEIEELEKNKEKYIMIKNGMMQKLLTGEIRLK